MDSNTLLSLRVRSGALVLLATSSWLLACSSSSDTRGGDAGAPNGAVSGASGATSTQGGGRGASAGASNAEQSGGALGSGGVPGRGGASAGGAAPSETGGRPNGSGGNSNARGGSAGMGEAFGGRSSGGRPGTGGKSSATGGSAPSGGSDAPGGSGIAPPSGYELVWHDEFDVEGAPNQANWKFEKGFVRNEEAQWYQPDNARVEGGVLVIEGRKQRVENPNYSGSGDWKTSRRYAEYTSSSLHTSGLQSFQYGRFEMRARIPTAAGMWPAWWTLGVSGEWPSNGEIDIMEFYNGKLLANVACGTATRWEAKWDSETKALSTLGSGWPSEFHVWRMDWDEQKIDLYLDDQLMNTTALSSMLNPNGASPFKQRAYMLVNLAIGGNNGGDPSRTTFPQRYEVDYIRVFQKM